MAFQDVYGEVLSTSVVAGYHDQSNDSYLEVFKKLLPPGRAWLFNSASGMFGLLEGMSYSYLRVSQRAQDLLREFDPRTTFELIPDWERLLDLPGTNPTPPTTTEGKRGAIHGKLLGHGDPTAEFFEEVAAGIGYDVVVKHKQYDPFTPGSVAGDMLTNHEWAFYWKVLHAPGSDDALVKWWIESLAPEHTIVDVISLGVEWTERTNPKNKTLNAIAHNGYKRFVAVGNVDGVDAYIVTSRFGTYWEEQSNPKNVHLNDIAYNGTDLWCAVGQNDGGDAYIVTSPDGETWTERVNPKTVDLNGIAHDQSGLWVAVGDADGGDAYMLTSPDGIVWTERSNPKNFTLTSVEHDGDGLWCAVGFADGTDSYIVTSPDGITWTEQTNPSNLTLWAVTHNGTDLWCAVGSVYIVTSPDGSNWTEQTMPMVTTMQNIAWCEVEFIAVGWTSGVDANIITSVDGVTWIERANPKSFHLYGIAYHDSIVVAVGQQDGTDAYIVTSGK